MDRRKRAAALIFEGFVGDLTEGEVTKRRRKVEDHESAELELLEGEERLKAGRATQGALSAELGVQKDFFKDWAGGQGARFHQQAEVLLQQTGHTDRISLAEREGALQLCSICSGNAPYKCRICLRRFCSSRCRSKHYSHSCMVNEDAAY